MIDNDIRVDMEKLKSLLGGGTVRLWKPTDFVAARCITDFESGQSAQDKFAKVQAWIEQTYHAGVCEGQLNADMLWKRKIVRMFGLD